VDGLNKSRQALAHLFRPPVAKILIATDVCWTLTHTRRWL